MGKAPKQGEATIPKSSKQQWTIRPVEPRDAITIARHRYSTVTIAEVDVSNYALWVAPQIVSGDYLGLVAECESQVIAGAGISILNWGPTIGNESPLRGRVVNVFTAEAWRRRGIAKCMLTRLIADARDRGVVSFGLGATEVGRKLYESLGFQEYEDEMILR